MQRCVTNQEVVSILILCWNEGSFEFLVDEIVGRHFRVAVYLFFTQSSLFYIHNYCLNDILLLPDRFWRVSRDASSIHNWQLLVLIDRFGIDVIIDILLRCPFYFIYLCVWFSLSYWKTIDLVDSGSGFDYLLLSTVVPTELFLGSDNTYLLWFTTIY